MFQTCMNFFLLLNTKYILKNLVTNSCWKPLPSIVLRKKQIAWKSLASSNCLVTKISRKTEGIEGTKINKTKNEIKSN